ncbi:MAG TPA: transposase [Verrucomicrobiae bacterium]|nr:transposase [Verrucomicrobiae bacterium]
MSQQLPKSGRGLPHNPDVRELVADKRKWSATSPQELGKRGFPGWHERGYLPHRDEPGLIQFVTFHLADSFPAALRSEWAAMLEVEDVPARREMLQEYLDKGRGSRVLQQPDVAKVVEDSLRFRHNQSYELRAWVVMPNHVHVLLKVGNVSLSRVVEDWKRFTAHAINQRVGRKGQLWFSDYWDTYMRHAGHEAHTQHYIEANPVKALLAREAKQWPWSSARLRDDFGRLCL